MRVETRQEYHGSLARLLAEVTQSPELFLDPEDLAAFFGFSNDHINRLFRDFFGEPARHFVRRLLLERAAYQLAHEECTITEAGLKAGYSSSEAFTKAFRKAF